MTLKSMAVSCASGGIHYGRRIRRNNLVAGSTLGDCAAVFHDRTTILSYYLARPPFMWDRLHYLYAGVAER